MFILYIALGDYTFVKASTIIYTKSSLHNYKFNIQILYCFDLTKLGLLPNTKGES